MRRFIHILLLLSFSLVSLCQEIKVVKLKPTQAIQAMTHRRDDTKGNACALLKIQLPINNVHFTGNIVGDVDFKTNEYWVYMPNGEKEIKVLHEGVDSVSISFSDYGIEMLESKITYELTLLEKRKDAPQLYNDAMIAWAENNIAQAYHLLKNAAENGYSYAYYSLGHLFDLQDIEDSFQEESKQLSDLYYAKYRNISNTEEYGNSSTQKNNRDLATLSKEDIRDKGLEYEKEGQYEKAIYWYQRGDEKGDHDSQYYLGRLFYLGLGVSKNYTKAAELFMKASFNMDDFYGIMYSLGYTGAGGYFQINYNTENCRNLAMAALAFMYMRGIITPKDNNEIALYSFLSGTDIGLNILALLLYNNKEYKKAEHLINLQNVPEKAIIDSRFMGDVYFTLGMINYWELGNSQWYSIGLGKEYFKKSAKLGNKKAQRIVDWSFIGNILPNGAITNKQNNNGEAIELGMIHADGTIYYSKSNVIGGKIDSNGRFLNSKGVELGHIDNNGKIYNDWNTKIGSVDNSGNVYDETGDYLGNINGFPNKYALLYFFFDKVAGVRYTDFPPDMKE